MDKYKHLRPEDIPRSFYRISVKALILDETRTRFLLLQEKDGKWELPGGGIDFGEEPEEALQREIKEETGLNILSVKKEPCYFTIFLGDTGYWQGNVLYEAVLNGFNFTPSGECVAVRFVTADEATGLNAFSSVKKFAGMFDPKRHRNV